MIIIKKRKQSFNRSIRWSLEDEEDSNADTDSQEAEEEGISLRLSEYFHV